MYEVAEQRPNQGLSIVWIHGIDDTITYSNNGRFHIRLVRDRQIR